MSIKNCFLLSFTLLAVFLNSVRAEDFTYEISDFSRNQFSLENQPDDKAADALYSISILDRGCGLTVTTGVTFKEIQPILTYLKLKHPLQLNGVIFKSTISDSVQALKKFALEAKFNGAYTPPGKEELIDSAAMALVQLEIPRFENVDQMTVFNAFSDAFKGFELNKKWFTEFCKRVSDASHGKVKIEEVSPDLFSFRIRGPAAYLKVTNGEVERLFTFGPYGRPFSEGGPHRACSKSLEDRSQNK